MSEPKKVPAKKAAAKNSSTTKKSGAAKKAVAKKTVAKKAVAKKAAARAAVELKADEAVRSRFFKRARERARRIADDPTKLREIAEQAERSSAMRAGPLANVLDEFRTLIRLVVAYARGHYRQISLDKLIVIVAALIYVVSPIDVIPDAFPGVGFLDDAALLGYVIKAVRDELDAFREWELGVTD